MNADNPSAVPAQSMPAEGFAPAAEQTPANPVGTVAEAAPPAADDGLQRLRGLGVPEEKLKNMAKRKAARGEAPKPPQDTAEAPPPGQDAADPAPLAQPRRMTWEEIMADPEYNSRMQAIVRRRLGQSKAAAAATSVQPVSFSPETEAAMQQHFTALRNEARQLSADVPDFDLGTALRDPVFARLVAPGSGIPLRTAFYAANPHRITAPPVYGAAQAMADDLPQRETAPVSRPVENGALPQAASVSAVDVKSKAYRDSIKHEMRRAAARGQKLYPADRR